MTRPKLWVCLYDIHHPQYNKKTFKAILSFIRQNHVDGLLLGGDALDLSCCSHWNANLPGNKRKGELKSDLDGFDKEILQPIEALLPRGCVQPPDPTHGIGNSRQSYKGTGTQNQRCPHCGQV